ncbi:hypothetical protein F5148DRAFT_1187792 [Russula earlei]|uniref:Uncharacterized protein n=1 Tax=Russula earlei TaxID=71964 RepID=A0ACC0UD14_9AGAM|nr:hypothetical protein F5148DRAFT_1187792 [Russula earlei]
MRSVILAVAPYYGDSDWAFCLILILTVTNCRSDSGLTTSVTLKDQVDGCSSFPKTVKGRVIGSKASTAPDASVSQGHDAMSPDSSSCPYEQAPSLVSLPPPLSGIAGTG